MWFVSLFPRAVVEKKYPVGKGADIFDTKEAAIEWCVKKRTDALGRPTIEWEDNG